MRKQGGAWIRLTSIVGLGVAIITFRYWSISMTVQALEEFMPMMKIVMETLWAIGTGVIAGALLA